MNKRQDLRVEPIAGAIGFQSKEKGNRKAKLKTLTIDNRQAGRAAKGANLVVRTIAM